MNDLSQDGGKGRIDTDALRARLERRRDTLLNTLRNMWRWGFEDAETGGIGELSLYDQHPADLGAELNARQVDLGLRQNMERTLEQIEKALQRIETGGYGTCENCGRQIDPERLEALPYVTLCITCQQRADEPESESPRSSDGLNPAHEGSDDGFHKRGEKGEDVRGDKEGVQEKMAGEGTVILDGNKPSHPIQPTQSSDEYARRRPGQSERPVEELSLHPPFGRTFRDDDDYVAYDGEDAWQDVARFGTSNTPQDVPPAIDYDETYVDADEDRDIVSDVDGLIDLGGQGVSVADIYPDPQEDDTGRRRKR